MGNNDVNDLNSDRQDCTSCEGGNNAEEPCCGSGNSHKQQDLKTLIFVLVLILAGAVAAHSIMNKDGDKSACGIASSTCGSDQVESGTCTPDAAKEGLTDDAAAGGCPVTGKTEVSEKTPAACCPSSAKTEEAK